MPQSIADGNLTSPTPHNAWKCSTPTASSAMNSARPETSRYFARPRASPLTPTGTSGSPTPCRIACRSSPRKPTADLDGGHGLMPGQFKALSGLAIDKNNRVFTSEQFPGRRPDVPLHHTEERWREKGKRDVRRRRNRPMRRPSSRARSHRNERDAQQEFDRPPRPGAKGGVSKLPMWWKSNNQEFLL